MSSGDYIASFVILAYNQEKYISEALQSALSQKCPPLEIIVSDDCSTDNTYKIINDTASKYSGPHKIILNRNEKNIGINNHINKIIGLCSRDIIIPAAGDDISNDNRSSELITNFENNNSLLVHSDYTAIDALGNEVEKENKTPLFYRETTPEIAATSFALFVGATVAWHKDLFSKYGPLPNNPAYEDLVLGFRAALEDRISYVDKKLVQYRVGTGVSYESERNDKGHFFQEQKKLRLKNLYVLEQRLKDALIYGHDPASEIVKKINNEIIKNRIRKDINEFGFLASMAKHYQNPIQLISSSLSEMNLRRKR